MAIVASYANCPFVPLSVSPFVQITACIPITATGHYKAGGQFVCAYAVIYASCFYNCHTCNRPLVQKSNRVGGLLLSHSNCACLITMRRQTLGPVSGSTLNSRSSMGRPSLGAGLKNSGKIDSIPTSRGPVCNSTCSTVVAMISRNHYRFSTKLFNL